MVKRILLPITFQVHSIRAPRQHRLEQRLHHPEPDHLNVHEKDKQRIKMFHTGPIAGTA